MSPKCALIKKKMLHSSNNHMEVNNKKIILEEGKYAITLSLLLTKKRKL